MIKFLGQIGVRDGLLYRNWPVIGVGIAVYSTILLLVNFPYLQLGLFLVWLQLPIYQIHQLEEHWYPGGFKAFANKALFKSVSPNFPFNDRNIFWLNILLIWILFTIVALLAQTYDLNFGVILPWICILNAITHIIQRSYNPGLITSIFLFIPIGIYTLVVLNQIGALTWKLNLAGLAIAVLVHIMLFLYISYHYRANSAF